jgi:hypothetical protein
MILIACQVFRGHRLAKIVSLCLVAIPLPKEFQMLGFFNAAGYHAKIHSMAEADYRTDVGSAFGTICDLPNKGAIDLQGIQG